MTSFGRAMFEGRRAVACLMRDEFICVVVGCVFWRGMSACMSRSLMVRVGVGSLWNFSCTSVLGEMFLHVCVLQWNAEPHGGASKVIFGVSHCCTLGCNLALGVLANMHAFSKS